MHGFNFIQDLAVILVVAGVVGWICQRIGLSVVVGYLVAGMAVGPHTPATLISNTDRIDTLAQIGLVFLMFAIGLRLSVRKMRRLGLSLLLATFGSAITIFYLCRLFAVAVNWDGREGFVLAAMLMVSSSAIISKILHETGATHERAGQLAMGVTVLEDIVAVVMLTSLNSMVQFGHGGFAEVSVSILMLGAFVVLAGIIGLLLVPWLLRRMSIAMEEELQTLGIAGLLFGLAVIAQNAGFSLALGAFLLGTIVAETLHRHQVERTFEGMRDVFSAVFFVAIGLQIDIRDVWHEIGMVVAVAGLTVLVRTLGVSLGLTMIGTAAKDALRTGLTMTPIGEFSFIIAQLGVAGALVPRSFYPLAVGVSVATTLAAPLLTRYSAGIATTLLRREPRWLRDWLAAYRGWLDRMHERRSRNLWWQLSRKRFAQVTVGMLFVTGLFIFSEQLFGLTRSSVTRYWPFSQSAEGVFWAVLVLVSLAPLVAIWRNLSAMALLFAELATRGHRHARRLRPIVETSFKVTAAIGIALWILAIIPMGEITKSLLLLSGAVALAGVLVLRRKLIYWHSEMEVEILSAIEIDDARMSATAAPWLQPHGEWNLHMVDCRLPDLADCQGKPISELDLRSRFGCSVVGIERQGFMIPLPPPDTVLYPRDKVLLLGTIDQVRAGQKFLSAVTGVRGADSVFEEVSMEAMMVPVWSRVVERTLGDLSLAHTFGVQVAGIHRGGLRVLNPTASERLCAGDEILVLGTPEQNAEFRAWLRENPDETAAEPAAAGG